MVYVLTSIQKLIHILLYCVSSTYCIYVGIYIPDSPDFT